jgi:hypothetical protein
MNGSQYIARRPDRAPFGNNWCGPVAFTPGEYVEIARYTAVPDANGQDVTVHCMATPARCYLIQAHAGTHSSGKALLAFGLNTGFGMTRMAVELATVIAGGKLRLAANSSLD